MFIFLILFQVLGKDFTALIETLGGNSFGMGILTQLQTMLQNKSTSSYDLIQFINQEEDNLVSEILNDMNNYQQKQSQSSETKQELKYFMLLAKFTQQTQNDELQLLQHEGKLAEDIKQQRHDLVNDLHMLLPLLETLKREEDLQFETQSSNIHQFSKLLSESFSGQVPLSGQKKKQPKEYSAQDLLLDISEKGVTANPLMDVINLLKQNRNVQGFEDKLKHLQNLAKEHVKYVEELQKKRKEQFENLRQRLQQDNDRWRVDMQQIEPIAKIAKEKLQQITTQQEELKQQFPKYQQKYNEIQEQIDNNYTTYSSKRLQDMNNLNLVRMIKQILAENTDNFEDFMRNKFKKVSK